MATALLRHVGTGSTTSHRDRPTNTTGMMDLIKVYRRHLPIFFLVASAIMLAAVAFTLLQPKSYTATSTLVIAPSPVAIGSDRSTPLSDPAADSAVDTQVEILKGRALAAAVVDRLGFADPQRFETLTYEARLLPSLGGKDEATPTAEARREMAIDRLTQGLDVHRTAQTFAIAISFTHQNRKLAADIVNTFANQFVAQSVVIKRGGASSADTLLRGQLASARAEVEAADTALGRYKVAHNLMSVQGSTIAEQQLSSLDGQVAAARAGEAEATARLETARQQLARGSSGDDLGEALNSPVIQQLRSQRAVVSAQVADMSGKYGDKYPQLAAGQRQLKDIDAQIQGEINRTISNLEAQQQVAARRTGSLAGSAGAARSAVAGNNIASVQLGGLQLRADTARTNYAQLLARVNETSAQIATTQADARVASLAPVPVKPSSPNVPINLLVGALLATAGGIGAVFMRQGTDQGIRTLEDVEGRLQLPYLAGLPTLSSAVRHASGSDPVAALLDHRESAYAEGYRNLAASVMDAADAGDVRTIALTSALPNEGKTTAAIGLARILAMSGKNVVLVDADMRRPSVANAMGLRPLVGLQHVLDGDATLAEALVIDEASGAAILPMLRTGKVSTASLSNGTFDQLLEDLKQLFEVVILDASPVLPVVDGRLVAKKADATVLLVRWRKTPDAAVEMAAHMLRSLGVTMTGVALTRIDLNSLARSGYGDPAQFLGSYSTYYAN